MKYEIKYPITEELLKLGARRYIGRAYKVVFLLLPIVILGYTILIIENKMTGILYFIAGALIITLLRLVRSYFRLSNVRKSLNDSTITLQLDDDSLTVFSKEYTTTIRWIAIDNVWIFKDICLLFPNGLKYPFFVVPILILPNDMREYFISKLKDIGKKAA